MKNNAFVKRFWLNHNSNANIYTQNLKGVEDYNQLFACVDTLYKNQSIKNSQQLYKELYSQSKLENKIKEFIQEKKMAPGMVLTFGTLKHKDVIIIGNQQELDDGGKEWILPMNRNSIFDLSSVTKIFTCLSILILVEENRLNLSDNIYDLDNRFVNLRSVTVEDLLTFRIKLKTKARIDKMNSIDEIESLIFNIDLDVQEGRLYSDMGAMVLKYVIERITEKDYFSFVKEKILIPCEMKDTNISVEDNKYVVSNNFEKKIIDNCMNCIDDICRGLVNDEKARKINQFAVQLHGHAGIFSTVGDMRKLVESIMQGRLINNQWIDRMGMNCTGSKKQDGTFTQFHGYLSYSKNPIEENSEVSHWLSGDAFALGGYTGNQLTIDRRNEVFLFMASNRCHNRVTRINSTEVVYEDGCVVWTDGKRYIQNQRYAYDRDTYIVRPALELALRYRYLELLLEQDHIDIACNINEKFL